MSNNPESNSRQYVFPIKVSACFFGLLLGFFILAPVASMQDEAVVVPNTVNGNMSFNGNYRPSPEPPKSTVRGRAIYADSGRAVRRASLMMLPAKGFASGGSGRENVGLTNERGEFEIKNVAEGRYYVSVNAPGVVTPFSSLSNFERADSTRNNPELADIASEFQEVVVNGITDIDVIVTARRGAAISGRVAYADGDSAIGVRVEILRKKESRYSAVMPNITEVFGAMFGGAVGGLKTDDRGVFRTAGLPAGEYVVRVVENVSHNSEKGRGRDDELMMLTGFNPSSLVSTYFPNTNDVTKAEVIKIELGQESPEINITIPERILHTISGVAINKTTRQPLKDAQVSIKNEENVTSLFGNLSEFGTKNQTDEQGRWSFKDLPPGKYTVTIQPPPNYGPDDLRNTQKVPMPKLAQTRKEIVVEEKDLTGLIVELGYGATVSGTISFDNQQLLPQTMTVTATEENDKFSETAFVYGPYANDGKPVARKTADFKIEGIPSGKIFLNLDGRRAYDEQEEPQFYVKSILLNGKDVNYASLDVKDGEEIKNVQIVLSKDVGKVKGKITRADKTPVAGAKLSFVPTDKSRWGNSNATLFASTGGDGEFEFFAAPGEYFVVFMKDSVAETGSETEKTPNQKRRDQLEKTTIDAQKVTIKAKETETLTLIYPDK